MNDFHIPRYKNTLFWRKLPEIFACEWEKCTINFELLCFPLDKLLSFLIEQMCETCHAERSEASE